MKTPAEAWYLLCGTGQPVAGRDLRYAVASLGRAPAFALTALIVLAVAIAANTAMFSIVYGVLIQPLPFPDADRVVRIWSSRDDRNLPFFSVSVPDFADWRARARNLDRIGAYERPRTVSVAGDAEQISVTSVSADLFRVLQVSPSLGRGLTSEDTSERSAGAAVISHGLWQRRYGSHRNVLGRSIAFDDRSWTIVGVMPPRFDIPNAPSDVWVSLPLTVDATTRSRRFLRVLGHVRQGLRIEDVQRELAHIAAHLQDEYPGSNRGWSIRVRPLVETVVSPEVRSSVVLLAGAVGFVLLMACANVAGLMLSRATARRREMAIRTALGASRAVLLRLVLLESLVLALAAGVVGVLLAAWSVDALKTAGLDSIPRLDDVTMNVPVLSFAGVITLLTVGLFGAVPAFSTSRRVTDALRTRDSSTDARASRSRSALIVGEVALAVVLLIGAGLMIRSLLHLQQRALGFDPSSLLIAQIGAPVSTDRVDLTRRTDVVVSRLAAVPGVIAASGGSSLPFADSNTGNVFDIEGAATTREPAPDADYRVVTPDYFRTLGIPIVQGRAFTAGDGPDAPVVIISTSAARRYWDHDPIGTRVRLGDSPWMMVVGVAGDARYRALDEPGDTLRPMMYVPHRQMPSVPLMFAVKTSIPPGGMAAGVRATLRAAAPDLPISRIESMAAVLAQARGAQRFATVLLGLFAWIAVLLAATGLYGLLAYVVSRRTKEIGVRVALGATTLDVVRSTAGQGVALSLMGMVLGIAGSLGLGGLLRSVLFEVRSTDPLTYVLVAGGFLVVASAASYLPAKRALRINPVDALRTE
jgi:putative ABC transport system permease protein